MHQTNGRRSMFTSRAMFYPPKNVKKIKIKMKEWNGSSAHELWLTEWSRNQSTLHSGVRAGTLWVQLPGGFWGRKNGFMGELAQLNMLVMQAFLSQCLSSLMEQIKKKKKNCQKTRRSTRKMTVQIGKLQSALLLHSCVYRSTNAKMSRLVTAKAPFFYLSFQSKVQSAFEFHLRI